MTTDTDTTLTGASDETLADAPAATPNPRDVAMAALARGRNATINAELEEANSVERVDNVEEKVESEENELLEGETLEGEDELETSEALSEETPEVLAEETPAAPASKVRMVSVEMIDGTTVEVPASSIRGTARVDGEDLTLSGDELITGWQKGSAAARKFEANAARAKELDARDAALREKEQSQPSSDAVNPALSSPDVRTRASEIVDSLFSGDADEATEAVAKILDAQKPSAPPDVNALAAAVSQMVEERSGQKAAGDAFKKSFPEIVKDPFLMNRADAFADQVEDEHPEMSKAEIFIEAGNRTREWIGSLAGEKVTPKAPTPAPAVSSTDLQARRVRKAEASKSVVTATSKIAGLGAPEVAPPTPSEIIAQMKAGRGQ